MYLLLQPVASYDRKRMLAGVLHLPDLFVHDEETAIRWLRRVLRVLQDDPKLLMWFDQAVSRDGGGA